MKIDVVRNDALYIRCKMHARSRHLAPRFRDDSAAFGVHLSTWGFILSHQHILSTQTPAYCDFIVDARYGADVLLDEEDDLTIYTCIATTDQGSL